MRQELHRRGGGGILAGGKTREWVGHGTGERRLVGVADSQRAQILARDSVELGRGYRQVHRVVANVTHFQGSIGRQGVLKAEGWDR